MEKLDTFTKAYIGAALWSSTDDDDKPLDRNYSTMDIAPETLAKMIEDCRKFQADNDGFIEGNSLNRSLSAWDHAGHDFWMTRNGEGVGFWETSDWEEEAGKVLTKAAKAFGEFNLYVGDDGKVHGG